MGKIFFFLMLCVHLNAQTCGLDWLLDKKGLTKDNAPFHFQNEGTIYSRTEITIPVVVHVVWNHPDENISDERILSQIDILNKDFNGANRDIGKISLSLLISNNYENLFLFFPTNVFF